MMDNQQARRVSEATRKFAEAVQESLRTVSGRTAEAQERTRRLTEGFFAAVTEELQTGTERNRELAREMAERSRAQQEAFREISEETARAYREFLGTVLAYYRTNAGRTREAAREGAGAVVQTPARLAAATTGALPISGYDEMNVSEVTSHLEGLTEQELRLLRDYEVENKNRRTVVGRIDRKLAAR